MSLGAGAASAWWQTLPEDFYQQDDGTEIDAANRWLVHGSAALDRVVRTALGSAIGLALTPTMLRHRRRESARMRFYEKYADRGRVEAVFAPPLRGLRVRQQLLPLWDGIPRARLSFESPFVPLHPEMVSSYTAFRRNAHAEAEHWTHANGPRPTLMFMHGFLLHPHALNARMFYLRWFWNAGYDVLLVKLPFHGARRALSDPFSGYGWFAHGIAHLNEGMLHAIHDARAWIDYLEARGAPSIGASGLSLGGYLSALLAAVDERLAFCMPNSPVVTVIDMAREWQPTRTLIATGKALGVIDPMQLRHATALHSPLTYAPRIAPERVLIIGGAGDRFTSPRFVRLLHDHWAGSGLKWFPGNHLLHFGQREYLKAMRRHMDLYSEKQPA